MSVATKDVVSSPSPSRLSLFWASTVGKKVLMALSGIVLFAYVVAHLLGNLQIYLGSELINRYAEMLHSNEGLLWTARIILLAAVLVHALAGFLLWLRRREARPIPYRTKENIQASAASRTMIWTGFVIAAFVVYHVLDLTVGVAHAGSYVELNPANNVVTGFSHAVPALLYVVAMIALGLHLWHGVYSMFGSLGLSHPRYTAGVKKLAALVATLIALANISIPVAVLTGLLHG
ncbi:MAG TPA: succinate dehydrogenase cytochrome b subunit [Anaeromyxobacteraceae bacterium]|nr:succinate dehydrogenase cytochrome b subunit [Anaeromyxobacteraceae bacterium]